MNLKTYYITIINELLGKLTNFVGNWRTWTNLSRWDCRFIDDPCEFKDTPAESLNWQRLTCEICSVWVVYCCDHVPAWWLFLVSPMSPLRFLESSNTTEKLHAKFGLHVLDTGSTHITWEDLVLWNPLQSFTSLHRNREREREINQFKTYVNHQKLIDKPTD